MKLIAYAHCSIPDVDAARRLYDVEGLDDKAVAKILFHRRKQQSGTEQLRPDQQRLAVVSLLHGEPETPRLSTLAVTDHSEAEMLEQVGNAMGGMGCLSGWNLSADLAVLRLRAAHSETAVPRLFVDDHQDLSKHWGMDNNLDEAARLMGLPGLDGSDAIDNWDAWQAGDTEGLRRKVELQVLSCWQLAQKLAVAQGRLTPQHARAGEKALQAVLTGTDGAHLHAYAAALEA
jgi:predicted PolB exonuclease-like 3'-5' exonuclease